MALEPEALTTLRRLHAAYASIVVAFGAWRWNDRRTRISLLADLLFAAVAIYAAMLLSTEILSAFPGGMALATYTVAACTAAAWPSAGSRRSQQSSGC